jgi:hypothetical protein
VAEKGGNVDEMNTTPNNGNSALITLAVAVIDLLGIASRKGTFPKGVLPYRETISRMPTHVRLREIIIYASQRRDNRKARSRLSQGDTVCLFARCGLWRRDAHSIDDSCRRCDLRQLEAAQVVKHCHFATFARQNDHKRMRGFGSFFFDHGSVKQFCGPNRTVRIVHLHLTLE